MSVKPPPRLGWSGGKGDEEGGGLRKQDRNKCFITSKTSSDGRIRMNENTFKTVTRPNWNKSSRALRPCQPTEVFTSSKLNSTAAVRSHKTEQKIWTGGDDITPLQTELQGLQTSHEVF